MWLLCEYWHPPKIHMLKVTLKAVAVRGERLWEVIRSVGLWPHEYNLVFKKEP
jgi:hypothetical protein